jgi:hypothetical protein
MRVLNDVLDDAKSLTPLSLTVFGSFISFQTP